MAFFSHGRTVRKTCLIHCTRGNDLPIQTALPTLAERGCPFVGSCSDLFVLNLTWMARWRLCASDVFGFVLAGMALHKVGRTVGRAQTSQVRIRCGAVLSNNQVSIMVPHKMDLQSVSILWMSLVDIDV